MKEQNETKLYRQGDLLLKEINEFPTDLEKTKDAILAFGEKTNHKHVLQKAVQIMVDRKRNKFFEAGSGTVLVHDEHKQINVPNGLYKVEIQREYSPQANRKVMD